MSVVRRPDDDTNKGTVMPFVWNKEVTEYKVDVFESSTLSYDR